jgi:hypothetical protein
MIDVVWRQMHLIEIFVGQKVDVTPRQNFRRILFGPVLRGRRRSRTRRWDRRGQRDRGQVLGKVLQALSSTARVHGRLGFRFAAVLLCFVLKTLNKKSLKNYDLGEYDETQLFVAGICLLKAISYELYQNDYIKQRLLYNTNQSK